MRYIVFLFTLLILSGCNNGDQGLLGEPGVLPEKVTELNVSPKVSKTPVGFSMSYKAEALLSNKLSYDVTNEEYITWHSSNNEVAVVNHKGIVTTVSEGDVIITATGIADDQTFSASA
ncbi:Ig-like domain-containing protein, partial [Vibrio hyugaensis]